MGTSSLLLVAAALTYLCPDAQVDKRVPKRIVDRAAETCNRMYHGCLASIEPGPEPQSYRVICRREK